ncbi:hypothetical protein OSH11_12085 [Kaistia dalseonensis]|uniref:Uncharacterized protein n=1 Tax=Kaistia dalseonensis TaxID=410840 RepID=A0ABU0H6U5_9HYPH|nr:hypothetical protein [Kaistia dalseonensis]MCX5495448.1 hypothetical protein [Kaistia dalseonensis]MDQ0438037.1 hypothetical protein [Kaistia dalseonensis]
MFKTLKKMSRSWNSYLHYDAETEALNSAGDRIDVELIHRNFSKNSRRPFGY